jgi:hypothetical protein
LSQCNSPFAKWSGGFPLAAIRCGGWSNLMPSSSSSQKMHSPPENNFQFEKLLAALVTDGVDFATVGGVAVTMNGYVRATEDAAIIVCDSPENLRKLLQCLEKWGEGFARELKIDDFTVQEGSIRVVEDFILDIFTQMRGKSLDDFRPRLRYLETGGVRIPYLSPADLIFLKRDSWRDKDKLDVQAMKEILARETQKNNSANNFHQGEATRLFS